MNFATGWTALRPWRNRNPGDLRTLAEGRWQGQVAVDDGPGGPFAVFDTRADGWRALAVCLLAYQDLHNLRTIRSIIGRYAPALENDTGGYISLVSRQIGVDADAPISARDYSTMMALVSAIALAEGGARIQWVQSEKEAGVEAALGIVSPPAETPIEVLQARIETLEAQLVLLEKASGQPGEAESPPA